MDFFVTMHAYLRFVILALGILGVLRSLVSLGTRAARFMRVDEVLSRGYSGALDLQVLVGVVLVLGLLGLFGQPRVVPSSTWIHPLVMLPAVVIAHLGRRFRDRPDHDRHRAQLGLYLISLLFIAAGLAVIGQLRLI
ncbi:MAG TPA: hypothetical protein VJG32_23295 [Anaerolineae bacterium]|nr:hypothetical protein [Anaerolineae bacterium]